MMSKVDTGTTLGAHSTSVQALAPVPEDKRIFGTISYTLMWWSSMIVIQAFVLGQGMLPPAGELNLIQALVVTFLAFLVILPVLFSLNAVPGLRMGIPYMVQCRPAFGFKGSYVAGAIRGIPAFFWYGIGSWIGASAITHLTNQFFGFGNIWVVFILFQIAQTFLAYYGIESIKWFETSMAVVIFIIMAYMLMTLVSHPSAGIKESWQHAGSWGMPFFLSLTAACGMIITTAVSISDFSRFLTNKPSANWLGHVIGLFPPNFFIVILGILAAATSGIWDPVEALYSLAPSPLLGAILLIFIVLAQFTTNITNNIVAPAMTLIDIFKITWGRAVIITGVISILTCPWILLGSDNFFKFIAYYAAFLGPTLGILLADYYIVRKQQYNVEDLYKEQDGEYSYPRGYSKNGLISLVVGFIAAIMVFELSWIIGLLVSGIVYILLMRSAVGTSSSSGQ